MASLDRVNMSEFKPFGLQTRKTTLDSIREENVRLRQSSSITSMRSSGNVSTVSRTFGLAQDSIRSSNIQNNNRLNQDLRNNNSSFLPASFGLHMRNLSTVRDMPLNDNSRFNQDSSQCQANFRSANEQLQTSNSSRIFGSSFRNTALTNRFQIQNRCNDEIDNGGFRVPSIPRLIRGRNPITSTRMFSHQSFDKSRNLSNINGFEVSHISRREMDTMSESKLGLMRNGWMDKQSVSGSVYSTNSVKAQAMNLLENLHYSILNMGPYISIDAVTIEFEKAKQGLENICEMSFAPSVRETDALSVISHSSKINYPAITDQTKNIINGDCLNLKSSKEVLKSLTSNADVKSKLDSNQKERKSLLDASIQNVELNLDENESCLVFKKPKPFMRKKKSPKGLKIRTPPAKKILASKVTTKAINLKHWYPIAVGNELALCGVDEEGTVAKTDPVKKRINNRKVELINGLCCNLIGSPAIMASALPKSVASLLKNGLTPRWKVLQKELLSCQTAEEEKQMRKSRSSGGMPSKKTKSPEEKSKRKSKSPGKKRSSASLRSPQKSPGKPTPETGSKQKVRQKRKKLKSPGAKSTPLGKIIEENSAGKRPPRPRVVSSPKKKARDVCTRSGRTVKPPSMFWMAKIISEDTPSAESSVKESMNETPVVKQTKKTKATNVEFTRSESNVVNSTVSFEGSKKSKGASTRPKQGPKKKEEELAKEVSSTEDSSKRTGAKRKLDTEAGGVRRKRSKIEKVEEVKVESTVANTKKTANSRKEKKTRALKGTRSPKPKARKSKNAKDVYKQRQKKAENSSLNTSETNFAKETEEDFEFQLDDIEIPQFGNLRENPQLSRSQMRLVSAETPPLKYFNTNLKVFNSVTPVQSPDWVISQRTESEVKQFQKRRLEAFKKKAVKKTESKKTVIKEKTQSRDLKKVMEWVAEKTVQSPQWGSKVLQYVLPSRRQLEQQDDEEEDDEFL